VVVAVVVDQDEAEAIADEGGVVMVLTETAPLLEEEQE
jgi:hypothetical protein